MPIYEYECGECGVRFQKLQRFGDPVPETCPKGHKDVHRLLSQPTIIFKGSGFYVTDNRRNGSGSSTSRGSSKAKTDKAEATTDTDKAEAKTEKKSEKKEA
jgi:putative FmdB family regulatory protein